MQATRSFLSIALGCSVLPFIANDLLAQGANANHWTRFRGDDGLGVEANCQVPIPWNDNQITKIKLSGSGNGSPVLWNDRAYLLAADRATAKRFAIAIDLTRGEIVWSKGYPSGGYKMHQFSTYASTTPCVAEDGVYFVWGEPSHVFAKCLEHNGDERWSRDLGRYVSQHGFGTSPMLVDDKLVLLDSQDAEELEPGVEPGEDKMIAFDRKKGDTRWETPLPTRRVCYGPPAIRTVNGRHELVCATTGLGIFGMDASTGKVLWNHDCFSQRVCSSPMVIGDLVIASHGSGAGKDNMLVAYDMVDQKERFRINKAAPYVPTSVAKGGLLFLWSDSGIVTCVRLSDGSKCWSERIGGNFYSSPVILGDRVVNISDSGDITVLAASEGFRKIATVKTDQVIRSTIAARDDTLLIRTDDELWIVRN